MKNQWVAGETFRRSKLNQPLFVQSGVYNGTTALLLQVSPGRIRFPFEGRALIFPNSQSVQLNGPQINTIYSLFVGPTGQIIASGHASFVAMPDPPQCNMEYIGSVQTQNPLSSPLIGPWNMAVSGHHETRGEYTAITPGRTRVMEAQQRNNGGIAQTLVLQSKTGNFSVASNQGLGNKLTLATATLGLPRNTYAAVDGWVQWMPSGSTATGPLYGGMGIAVDGIQTGGAVDFLAYDTRAWATSQNPDNLASGVSGYDQTHVYTPFRFVVGSGADADVTFTLAAFFPQATPSTFGARITGYGLIVEPSRYRSRT